MTFRITAILLSFYTLSAAGKNIDKTATTLSTETNDFDNNIIDFETEYFDKPNHKYERVPWHDGYNKEANRYTIVNEFGNKIKNKTKSEEFNKKKENLNVKDTTESVEATTSSELGVIPIELLSTTENYLVSIVESTTEPDLTVIPLSTTEKITINISQTVILPTTQSPDSTTEYFTTTDTNEGKNDSTEVFKIDTTINKTETSTDNPITTTVPNDDHTVYEVLKINSSHQIEAVSRSDESTEPGILEFTDLIEETIPEDYYDTKDVIPTKAPNTDALSVIFGLAGSVVESVAERVVPKGIFDLFKRLQKQNEALEAERLRSREENGGLGQFGRGILKSISSGLSGPLSQLMAGAKDIGSLDNDRGFVGSLASGVTSVANVANSVVDAFKDRVQAIYPGTLWCGDGHSPNARSGDLGLFLFTDTCCRQHDDCKIFIRAGETKYGLTNTGLFTRSHCSCDAQFRECLKKTSSLVSGQIGLTYFNVLGPQCFRKTHPIVRCVRRTRLTGQKCEEYELDYTKPKMWQWFDNETF